jgi:hypothetical protein
MNHLNVMEERTASQSPLADISLNKIAITLIRLESLGLFAK